MKELLIVTMVAIVGMFAAFVVRDTFDGLAGFRENQRITDEVIREIEEARTDSIE